MKKFTKNLINFLNKKIPAVYLCLLTLGFTSNAQEITTGILLNEMTDLERLTRIPERTYQTLQYSSYDRSSVSPSAPGWFANNDGFGREPNPNFEEVLVAPDSEGMGRYLIADIEGPGALLRFWTVMTGEMSIYLDGSEKPLFQGDIHDFLEEMAKKSETVIFDYQNTFRQFDGLYFPIVFAENCRIEWTGNVEKLHFYHVNVRLFEDDVKVKTFAPSDLLTYASEIRAANSIMLNPDSQNKKEVERTTHKIAVDTIQEVLHLEGEKAIDYFEIKVNAEDPELLLRQTVLNIYFDNASVPQIQSPIGDFFGAAPGINPYRSLPFSVNSDGTMVGRFLMPFKSAVRMTLRNYSDEEVELSIGHSTRDYDWEEGSSMHLHAKWRIDHNLTASNTNVIDVPYLMAMGKGRIVGGTSFLFNPSNIPHSGGSWWGEGDEKIFLDDDNFPSYFGTGTEDYYNYSWSSTDIFAYPYSGQPRNDGPGNRGFVANYRWHILDDISFKDKLAFYMELYHHEEALPGFSYGRMVYLYALPDLLTDHMPISRDDVREIQVDPWSPEARNWAAGYRFIEAEELFEEGDNLAIDENRVWSEGDLLMWSPASEKETLEFRFDNPTDQKRFALTLANTPKGGKISLLINGEQVKLNEEDILDLKSDYHEMLRTYWVNAENLKKNGNQVVIENQSDSANSEIGIDFIWVKE